VVITARHLLTHSSSILDREDIYFSETSYHPGGDNPLSLGDFLKSYFDEGGDFYHADNFADYAPGTGGSYSNVGAGLTGYLVEVISGQALNEFSKEKIFAPLQMGNSGWMLAEIDTGRHAKLYEWDGLRFHPVEWYGLVTWPDGGVRTSVDDLARFYRAMMNEGQLDDVRIMQADTVRQMFTPQFSEGQVLEAMQDEPDEQQALAWNYRVQESGQIMLGHSGGDPGVTTYAYFYPDLATGIILLVNTSSENEAFNRAVKGLLKALQYAALKRD
jgi:CubicO group peptidase (beta-lactamase class C family)